MSDSVACLTVAVESDAADPAAPQPDPQRNAGEADRAIDPVDCVERTEENQRRKKQYEQHFADDKEQNVCAKPSCVHALQPSPIASAGRVVRSDVRI